MSGGWNTIESDAGVFTYLIEKLGVEGVQCEELVMLEAEELQRLSPIYGVIFLFKYPSETSSPATTTTNTSHQHQQPLDGTYDFDAADSLFFASQVIQNACGTQALLSVLLNKDTPSLSPTTTTEANPRDEEQEQPITLGPALSSFKSFTTSFPPSLRGECLSNSALIRSTHNSFARSSPFIDETARPSNTGGPSEDIYHFIAYASLQNTLYELDGLHPAPISHGPCPPSAFPSLIIPVLQRRIARYPASEIRFNLMALVRDRRQVCREAGDWEGLEREEAKRREWHWENGLRRHNFLGFGAEVLKAVVRGKLEGNGEGKGNGDDAYKRWVSGAVETTRKRREMAATSGKGGGGQGDGMDMDLDS